MSETQEQVESVADSIRAAIAEQVAADSLEAPAEEAPESPAEEPQEVVEATEAPEGDKEPSEAPESAPEPDSEAKEVEEAEAEPEEVILAPASWSKTDREVFSKLDTEAQKIIARREAERDKVTQRAGQDLAPMKAVIDEFGDYFQRVGMTPDQSFRGLVSAEQSLRFGTPTQKTEALAHIARSYGIPMPSQTALNGQASEEAFVDPEVAALRDQFSGELGEIKQLLTTQQQVAVENETQKAQTTAARFFEDIEAADPTEIPESRYIDDVMPEFQRLVAAEPKQAGTPDVARLKQLFSNAAWATPGVRERMLSDTAQRTEAKAKTQRKVAVRTSSSASGGTGVSAHSEEPPVDESVEDTIKRSMAEVNRLGGSLT